MSEDKRGHWASGFVRDEYGLPIKDMHPVESPQNHPNSEAQELEELRKEVTRLRTMILHAYADGFTDALQGNKP